MTRERAATAPVATGREAYRAWRASPLGTLTDRCEAAALDRLIGAVAGQAVLDVGCGDGTGTIALARRGAMVTGIDPDPAMLAAARANAAAARTPLGLARGRIEALPFADDRFDLVLGVTVLCFVREADRAWAEMARVLRPGGRLVIGELGRWSLWAARRRIRGWLGSALWRPASFHTAGTLRRAAETAGLTVEGVRGAVFHPPSATVARLTTPVDAWLGRRTTFGAAFIALAACKP